MAELLVEAEPSDGLENYGIIIDGNVVPMIGNAGTTNVNGVCGDGSMHGVVYGFDGPAGETLSFTIKCGEVVVYAVAGALITPANAPHGNGGGDFLI